MCALADHGDLAPINPMLAVLGLLKKDSKTRLDLVRCDAVYCFLR